MKTTYASKHTQAVSSYTQYERDTVTAFKHLLVT
jgi:hypothetical protein